MFWIAATFVILEAAGHAVVPIPSGLARTGAWVLFGMLVLGTLMNLASRSRLERSIQTPVAGTLAVLCLLVALAAGERL